MKIKTVRMATRDQNLHSNGHFKINK